MRCNLPIGLVPELQESGLEMSQCRASAIRDSAAYIIASPHLPSSTLQPRPHEMRTIEEAR